MARFTVSDCLINIPNRFDMTLSAAIRARQLEHGNESLIPDNKDDKVTVLALREIARNRLDNKILRNVE